MSEESPATQPRHRHLLMISALVALTILGSVAIARLPTGLHSLSFDSYRYLAGAESLRDDGAYRDLDGTVQSVWPPGLPLLYAGLSLMTGTEPLQLVRAVNLASYMASAIALMAILLRASVPFRIGVFAAAAILMNTAFASLHNKLLSEPPTFALLLVLLATLVSTAPPRRAALRFVPAAMVAGAAMTLRFAMFALLPLLGVTAFFARSWRALLIGASAVAIPFTARALVGSAGRERVDLVPATIPWRENATAIVTLVDQFVPIRIVGDAAAAAVLPGILIGASIAAVRGPRNRAWNLTTLSIIWVLSYGGFLLAAQAFATPSFTLDLRILLPLHIGVVLAAAGGATLALPRSAALAFCLAIPLALAGFRGGIQIARGFAAVPDAGAC